MGKHESIGDSAAHDSKGAAQAKRSGEPAKSGPASDDSARAVETANIALATIEAIKVESPMLALASADAPKLAPGLDVPGLDEPKIDALKIDALKSEVPQVDQPKGAGIEPPPSHAAGEAPAEPVHAAEHREPARLSRFTLLAASLVLCAAFGAMIGALVAAGITRPVPVASGLSPSVVASAEDVNALKEQLVQARIDFANLKASIDASGRSASVQLSKIGERVERMERSQSDMVKLTKAIDALERRADQFKTAREATGSIPSSQPAAKDASRATVVDGWVLREVDRGTAIIEGRIGLVEVDQGDVIPGIGRVEAIRKQDGRWVVVTPKGLIVPAR